MSDGPHRSLIMHKVWKKVAEYADRPAYSQEEVSEAMSRALIHDWKVEVPENLLVSMSSVLTERTNSLFVEERAHQLEQLGRAVAGSTFGRVILDIAISHVYAGGSGMNVVVEAVIGALSDRAARSARQIEEHYRRNSNIRRTVDIRARIEEATATVPFEQLAQRLLGIENPQQSRTVTDRSGLDDGVGI